MRARFVSLLAVVAVVAAACGGGGGETVVASGEALAAPLAYAYVGGEHVTYRFAGSVSMEASMDGSGAMSAGGLMGDTKVAAAMTGTLTVATTEGEEPGTTVLTMTMDVADLRVDEFTMDGQEVPGGDPSVFLDEGFEFPATEVVVDAQGNVLSVSIDGEELPAAFAAAGGGFGPASTGFDPTMFMSPSFPEGDLTLGSEWVTADSLPLPGMGEVSTRAVSKVTDTLSKDGHELFRIDTSVEVDRVEVDLFEMMAELAASDPAAAEFGDMGAFFPDGMSMKMAVEPGEIAGTTWFDATSGLVAKASVDLPMEMSMDMTVPGEGSASIDMSMELHLDLTFVERAIITG